MAPKGNSSSTSPCPSPGSLTHTHTQEANWARLLAPLLPPSAPAWGKWRKTQKHRGRAVGGAAWAIPLPAAGSSQQQEAAALFARKVRRAGTRHGLLGRASKGEFQLPALAECCMESGLSQLRAGDAVHVPWSCGCPKGNSQQPRVVCVWTQL